MKRRCKLWAGATLIILALGRPVAAAPPVIGELGFHVAAHGDTLPAIARRYGLGFIELRAANPGVDPWLPGPGTAIRLPSAHLLPDVVEPGITINLAEQRLYFIAETGAAETMPIGIGRAGWETPLGDTSVVGKRENPTWIPPASLRAEPPELPAAVAPGPTNPLGSHAIDLAWQSYSIHGTIAPFGVGRRVSHGCIRLFPEDVVRLFRRVRVGTAVRIMDRPVKLAWIDGELHLEVHPSQAQGDELEARGAFTPERIDEFEFQVVAAARGEMARLDWATIRRVAAERLGIPVQITR